MRDQDVMALTPEKLLPDVEQVSLPSVTLQYAQLLRVIRENSSSSATFHVANFEHWREAASAALPALQESRDLVALQIARMASQVLLSIMHAIHLSARPDELQHITETARAEHIDFLTTLQSRVHSQDYAIAWLDAVHVFAVGVCLCYLSMQDSDLPQAGTNILRPSRICIELLTVASERWPDARSLRDLLTSFSDFAIIRDQRSSLALQALLNEARAGMAPLPRRDRQFILSALNRSESAHFADSVIGT